MLYQIPIPQFPRIAGIHFDNASVSPYEAALSTYTFTHRVGTGISNRCLIVGVSIFASGSVTSITYNGVALTFIRSDTNGVYRSELWQLVAPATGSNTVEVTLSASLTSIANAQSYSEVNQTTPIDANNGGNGTGNPASASVTTVTDKDRVVGNLVTQTASGVTSQANQAPRTTNTGALGTASSDDKGIIDTAGSVSLQWNNITVLQSWAVSLAALKPVGEEAETITLDKWFRETSQPIFTKHPEYTFQSVFFNPIVEPLDWLVEISQPIFTIPFLIYPYLAFVELISVITLDWYQQNLDPIRKIHQGFTEYQIEPLVTSAVNPASIISYREIARGAKLRSRLSIS